MKHPPSLPILLLLVACSAGPSPKRHQAAEAEKEVGAKPVPQVVDAVIKRIGAVVAVEVEQSGHKAGFTRDAASVARVLAALGAPDAWQEAGMPRCRTHLRARLVPPSAEGGASFLFCKPLSSAYLLANGTSYVLPAEASETLGMASAGLALPEQGSIPPVFVTDNLERLLVVATIATGAGREDGLRTVGLTRGHRLEPHAIWPDGTPMGLSFDLDAERARAMVDALALAGFFQRSTRFHSAAVADPPTPPPANSTEGAPESPQAPAGWVGLTASGPGWHRTWHEAQASAIFAHTLDTMTRALGDGEHAEALKRLELP
jgi:hypothetical protein